MAGDNGGFRRPVPRAEAGRGIYLSKSDLVGATLRDLIIAGELTPGTALRQREIAARLAVSSTPVREALRRLASEGLVTYDAHRGSVVTEVGVGGMREKYEIRAVLDGLAARLAAPHVTDENMAELARYNDRLRRDDRLSASEVNRLIRAFHFRLYELAHSPLLMSLVRLLWQSFPGVPRLFRPQEESLEQHSELLAALRARDAERAQLITEQHVLGAIPHLAGLDGGGCCSMTG